MGLKHVAVSLVIGLTVAFAAPPLMAGDEPIDYASLQKIRDEGLTEARSKVMDTAWWMTDAQAARLSGSVGFEKAAEWAVGKLKEWGVSQAATEPWLQDPTGGNNGFPRGWENQKFYMHATAPHPFQISGMSTAWTPGTDGLVRGEVVLVTDTTETALKEKWAGKLKGKWIIAAQPGDVRALWTAPARRYTQEQLEAMEIPARGPEFGAPAAPGRAGTPATPATPAANANAFNRTVFFKSEGALGLISANSIGHGIFTIGGAARTQAPGTIVPQVVIAREDYNRIARLLARGQSVAIEADIKNSFRNDPPMYNVIGEIRGSDKADEIVMIGAHFDAWHASTGATDNAAGSAVMMEAMRILKASGVPLRRSVRIGLWNGEEQGLFGSRLYVARHFGGVRGPGPAPPAGQTAPTVPLTADHARFQAYFNVDNGTGAIRGVYAQSNPAMTPIFRQWMEPLRDLGVAYVNPRNTGSTDHVSFDNAGLPGFQFIQDEVEYNTFTHHTNLDTYDQLQPEDMRRNAVIVATFAFLAANRPDLLPRKAAPVQRN